VGYHTISTAVRLPTDGTVTLDLSLSWEPVLLPALLVRARPVRPLEPGETPPSREVGELALRALEGTPGMVEGGLAQVVRSLPGNDPSEPRDVLLMRGSAADLKLVLLDGAPVYTPFHMAGLVESFDPQALGGASLFLGGAPSRFDGGLSYILDLQGRSPRTDRIRGNAALDLLTGRAFLEGPLGSSTGFLLSARGIHDLGTPLLAEGSSPYGFGDLLGRLEWSGQEGGRAYLTGFWNQESVVLDLSDDAADALEEAPDFGNNTFLEGLSSVDDARWGNRALAAGYEGSVGGSWIELRGALSRYDAELPLGDTLPIFAESRTHRGRLTADVTRPWGPGTLRLGVSVDRVRSSFEAMALDSARLGEVKRTELSGTYGGMYVEGTRPMGPSWTLRGGARVDRFQGDTGFRLAPRLSLTWMLTESAALTVAAGRYHQYSNVAPDNLQEEIGADAPASGTGTGGSGAQDDGPLELSVGTADHLVVSLDQLLTPKLRLGLEGFVKEFTGVPGSSTRSLHASGVDLRVARDGDRAAGWLGYTLTWFWAPEGLVTSGSSPFSGRHLLSAGLSASLTDRAGVRLLASYGDGLPFTSVPVYQDAAAEPGLARTENRALLLSGDQVLNSAPELAVGPDEGFLRLELEIFGRWTPTVSGRSMDLRPYLRVLNALNRRDALFYHFDPWRDQGPQPLADLPVLPLVGLEWRF
jgi:hypothetical protein